MAIELNKRTRASTVDGEPWIYIDSSRGRIDGMITGDDRAFG